MTFALTTGEPAGIGPDIVLQLWAKRPELFTADRLEILADKNLLSARAKQLGIKYQDGDLPVKHLPLSASCTPSTLNTLNADYVMNMLTVATQDCVARKYEGMITGPIHKGILNDAGYSIAGHTDFLTKFTKVDRTVMMLMTDDLRVALFSDHVPLRAVPDLLTPTAFARCLDIIIKVFHESFNIKKPRILICGLNPHAGENGYLGTEEQTIMAPVIAEYKAKGHDLIGPVAADTAFTPSMQSQADVTLAMYHDQGLPTLKYAGFHQAINVTLGLPFIRTSVDHGTALPLAGTGQSDPSSLHQAILLANSISTHRKNYYDDTTSSCT